MDKKRSWILFIALALVLIILRSPSFEMPLDPDSGANAFFARHMLRGETLYDKFHPAHHVPGIYYTFELAFRLFGDNPLAPKLLLFPWTLACAWLIYLMGRSFFDHPTGIIGAFLFVLISSQRWVSGMTAEMEHFANLPLIAGMFIAIVLLRKQAPAWQFIWVGVLAAISILYKVIFVAPLIVTVTSILVMAWVNRNEAGAWKTMLSRLSWLIGGFIVPLIIVAAYFASLGLWERFILVFKLGLNYMHDAQMMIGPDLPPPFGFPLFWMSVNNIAALFFGLMGTYRLARQALPVRNTDNLTDFALTLWLIVSFALTGMRGGGLAHYVLPLIPPLALMAAVEINMAYQRWKTTSFKNYALPGAGVCIALIVINFIWLNHGLYSYYLNYKFGRISRESFLRDMSPDGYASQTITEYIKTHTTPDDFIYIWSIYVDIYYYADRTPPTDILWSYYVSATGSPERIFDPRTKYIVLDTPERMQRPQWLLNGLATYCNLETALEGREIYRCRPH